MWYHTAMADYVRNTKAHFNYEILDEYEAGIELLGSEVKSLRASHGRIEGAHVIVRGGEAFLVGMDLPPYQANNARTLYDPLRTRKLLMKKKEIAQLVTTETDKGLTLIALSLYNKGTKIKIKVAVARGKKKFDKRETIKNRDTIREAHRVLKGGR
jgi:SsrA-binding protein